MSNRAFPRRALLLLALAGAAGCVKPTDDPVKTFRLFVERVQAQDTDGAWELLSRDTRGALTDLVARRSAASGGAIPADPKQALFGSATLARPIAGVEVAEPGDRRAVLRVTHPGGDTQSVTMVKEEGGWRLQLEVPPAAAP
jgi:hypothetical protein